MAVPIKPHAHGIYVRGISEPRRGRNIKMLAGYRSASTTIEAAIDLRRTSREFPEGYGARPLQISQSMAKVEVERSERIGLQLRPYDRIPGLPTGLDSEKLVALFGLLTGKLSPEDYSAYWWAK